MTSQDSFYSSLDLLNKSITRAAQILRKHPLRDRLYLLPPRVNEQLMHLWDISEFDYSDEGEENPKPPSYALGIGTTTKEMAEKGQGDCTDGELIVFYDCCRDEWIELTQGIQHEPADVRMLLAKEIPTMLLWYGVLLSDGAKEVQKLCESIDDAAMQLSTHMEKTKAELAQKKTPASKPQAKETIQVEYAPAKPVEKKTIQVEYAPAKPVEKKTIQVEYAPAKAAASKPQTKKPKP
jgi:hypothetical protein